MEMTNRHVGFDGFHHLWAMASLQIDRESINIA